MSLLYKILIISLVLLANIFWRFIFPKLDNKIESNYQNQHIENEVNNEEYNNYIGVIPSSSIYAGDYEYTE